MIFSFEERPSDSPFVETIWRTQSERAGAFSSLATSHWEIVVTRHNGKMILTVRGPETKATPMYCSVQAEWFGIIFKFGTFMPDLPASDLVDGSIDLPEAASKSFWLHRTAWQFPDFDNADTFVNRLVHEGLLVSDPIVGSELGFKRYVDEQKEHWDTKGDCIGIHYTGWCRGGAERVVVSLLE